MEIKVYGKPVMTKFVVLDGKEFELQAQGWNAFKP